MMNSDHYFGARSFSKPRATEVNGFIENVDRDLRKFYHTHQRSVCVAYVLAVCLGMFGVHHFYLGRKWYGVMYLCTFGLFGVGYVVDLFRLASLVRDANIRRIDEEEDRTLMDLYILWFPCGILGFHHFYLRNPLLGLLYLLTGGIWGLGWIVDGIHLSGIVQQYNNKEIPSLSIIYAYLFMLPPFGILGFHHYYCRRMYWGLLYSLTLGCFLLGWTVDFIRIPFLVSRTEEETTDDGIRKKYYSDDAYVLWMSFGLLGFHHFYLKRYRWGIVYALTLGLFGVGWVVDAFRIPHLVRQLNLETEEEEDIAKVVSNFHKQGHSVISSMRKNDNYTRFDDVMQKHPTDGSPKIFTTKSNENVMSRMQGSCVDDVISDDDSDGNMPSSMRVGQLRRTVSNYSNSTQTVTVDVHHVPNPEFILSCQLKSMTPVSLKLQGQTNKQSVREKQITGQSRDGDTRNTGSEIEAKGMTYHELSNQTDEILSYSNVNHDTVVQVKTGHRSKKRTNSRKTQQQKGSDVTKHSFSVMEKNNIEQISQNEWKESISTETENGTITKVNWIENQKDTIKIVQKDGYAHRTSEKTQKRETDNYAESKVKGNASVTRSYSVISQKTSSQTDVMENSMTSIDVNRMSIPILNDNPAFINDDGCDTPRSGGVMTPRVDSDGNNSLPRVIKVRKNRSMGQAKRDLRRSIKRSQRRAKSSEEKTVLSNENGDFQAKAVDG
uniref:Uncharacterized protein LOC111115461 n=1 Tax=Crassostrea virginica TaxID=6565 RepID=A0A8B8C4R6_CRAVI|nr:uncharacterized protein LOC111115461 [Crassostrea virginica]